MTNVKRREKSTLIKWVTCDKQVDGRSEERPSESRKESKMPQWHTLAVLLRIFLTLRRSIVMRDVISNV